MRQDSNGGISPQKPTRSTKYTFYKNKSTLHTEGKTGPARRQRSRRRTSPRTSPSPVSNLIKDLHDYIDLEQGSNSTIISTFFRLSRENIHIHRAIIIS